MKNKYQVILFMPSSYLSGAENRFINIGYYLLKRKNYNVGLAISKRAYEMGIASENVGPRLKYIQDNDGLIVFDNSFDNKKGILYKLNSFFLLFKLLFQYKPKVLHTALWSYYALPLIKLFNVKVVYEITSPDSVDNVLKFPKLLNYADLKVAVSESVYQRFLSKYKGPKKNIDTLYVSQIPFYIPWAGESNAEKENIMVYCSRFLERKNPVMFLKAGLRILDQYSDYKLVMLGDGQLKPVIEELVSQSNHKDRISVYKSKNTREVFERSKIYVGLIYPDNVPSQAALEALDAGNFIIVSNTGKSEIFVSNENGIACNLDEDAVFEAMSTGIKLTNDNMPLYINRSKELIDSRFPADKYIEGVEAYYDVFFK